MQMSRQADGWHNTQHRIQHSSQNSSIKLESNVIDRPAHRGRPVVNASIHFVNFRLIGYWIWWMEIQQRLWNALSAFCDKINHVGLAAVIVVLSSW